MPNHTTRRGFGHRDLSRDPQRLTDAATANAWKNLNKSLEESTTVLGEGGGGEGGNEGGVVVYRAVAPGKGGVEHPGPESPRRVLETSRGERACANTTHSNTQPKEEIKQPVFLFDLAFLF